MDPNQPPMVNPMMLEAMNGLTEQNFFFFLMQNSDLIEVDDWKVMKKDLTYICRNVLISAILGVALNVQIKRIPKIDFLTWNRFLRWGTRIPIFFLPYAVAFHWTTEDKIRNIAIFHQKYFKRMMLFRRTGDMKALDPHGKLFQQFQSGQMK